MDWEFFLNLFSLLTSISVEDEQLAKNVETRLINDIKKRASVNTDFSLKNPPEATVRIYPYLLIKHVIIDEDSQMVTIHGRMNSIWRDSRWTWNASEYENLGYMMRTQKEMRNYIWVPELKFQQTRLFRESIDRHNGWITIYGGIVNLLATFSIEIDCDFDGSEYPFDRVKCTFFLVTSNDVGRLTTENNDVYYHKQGSSADHHLGRPEKFHSGEFVSKTIQRTVVKPAFGSIFDLKTNPSVSKKILGNRTMFEVAFERRVSYYFGTMLGPLIVMVVLMLVIACLPSSTHTFHILFGLLACQLLFGCFLASALPKVYSKLPVIAVLAIASFTMNIGIIMLKAVLIYFNNRIKGDRIRERIEKITVMVTVSPPSLLLFAILVHFYNWRSKLSE